MRSLSSNLTERITEFLQATMIKSYFFIDTDHTLMIIRAVSEIIS